MRGWAEVARLNTGTPAWRHARPIAIRSRSTEPIGNNGASASREVCQLPDFFDHLDELVDGISLAASELDELPNFLHDGSALGRPGHDRAATASKFEQPLVLKQPQRAQDGVGVDPQDGRKVSCRRKSLTGLRLSVRDRTPNLGGDLLIEVGPSCLVQLDTNHCASNTSSTVGRRRV
jgi:hypothetical protein